MEAAARRDRTGEARDHGGRGRPARDRRRGRATTRAAASCGSLLFSVVRDGAVRARRDGLARRCSVASARPSTSSSARRRRGSRSRTTCRSSTSYRPSYPGTTSSSLKRLSGNSVAALSSMSASDPVDVVRAPASESRLEGRREREHRHPGGLAGLDPGRRVLDHEAVSGIDRERRRAREVRLGIRLAALDVVGGDQMLGDRKAAVRETTRSERPGARCHDCPAPGRKRCEQLGRAGKRRHAVEVDGLRVLEQARLGLDVEQSARWPGSCRSSGGRALPPAPRQGRFACAGGPARPTLARRRRANPSARRPGRRGSHRTG